MKEQFYITVRDGSFRWNTPDHIRAWLRGKSGKFYFREPISVSSHRTHAQNRLLWKRNHELSEITGYTPEEIHAYIVTDCGYIEEMEVAGKKLLVRLSSKGLSTKEFNELIDKQTEIARSIDPEIQLTCDD